MSSNPRSPVNPVRSSHTGQPATVIRSGRTLSEWMLDVEITGSGTPAAIAADSQDVQALKHLVEQEEADSIRRAHALIDAFIDRVVGSVDGASA